MKRLLLLGCLSPLLFGQSLEGIWQGTLAAGASRLRVVFHISKSADGKFTGSIDSPDQGARGIPVSAVTRNGQSVRIESAAIGATYEGVLAVDGKTLTGKWQQRGTGLPLALERVEKAPEIRRPQEPSRPYPYDEEEVSYENKKGGTKFSGTLTLPRAKGRVPAVILLSGSGAQDRNGTVFGHRPFLVLADYLTRRGVAVLRVDDRGVGGSTGDLLQSTIIDLAGDARAGVDFLKGHKAIDAAKIGLVGHSEGALVASCLASESKDLSFIVLLAGSAVVGEQLLYKQSELIVKVMGVTPEMAAISRNAQQSLFRVIKEEKDPALAQKKLSGIAQNVLEQTPEAQRELARKAMQVQFQALQSRWFRFFVTYDPAPALKKVTCPVLALFGEKDLQVPPDQNLPAAEAALKAGGNKDHTAKSLPQLNHLFQTAKTGSPTEYPAIEETIAPVALETIADWIGRHVKPAR